MSRKDADNAMKGQPPGTYFTRVSSSDGLDVVVFVDESGNVVQAKVYTHTDGTLTTQPDVAKRNAENTYASLGVLITRQKLLQNPMPKPVS